MIVAIQLLTLVTCAVMTLWALSRWKLYGFLFGALSFYAFIVLIGIPSLVTEFGYADVARAVVIGLFGTFCLCLCTLLVEFVTGPTRTAIHRNPILEIAGVWPYYCASIVLVVFAIAAIVLRRGPDVMFGNWEDMRSTTDRLDSVASVLQFFVFPSAWVAFRNGRRAMAALLLLVGVTLFPIMGSRAGLLSLPAIIALEVSRLSLSRRRIFVLVAIVVVGGLTMHTGGRLVRGLGAGGVVELVSGQMQMADIIDEVGSQVDWTGGETEIARYFVYSVSGVEFEGVSKLASVVRWLTIYVPRTAAPELKPEDVTYVIWRKAASDGIFESYPSLERMLDLLRGGESGSVHPILWGEMWVNGGGPAMLVACAVLAVLVVFIERLLDGAAAMVRVLVEPATIVGYFMIARGNSFIGLGYFFYLMPVALVLYGVSTMVSAAVFSRAREANNPTINGAPVERHV